MREETIDNKKIVVTNRVAIVILLSVISLTFGATKFYDETRYQQLVSEQNKERIELVNENIKAFVEQELQGLRADWERDRMEQNKRLEKLEN